MDLQPASTSSADFDSILSRIHAWRLHVRGSRGSLVQVPKGELELLSLFELARDVMLILLQRQDGRTSLLNIFGGDCVRISKLRAMLEAAHFSESKAADQRLQTCSYENHGTCVNHSTEYPFGTPSKLPCFSACESVEKVLEDVGLGRTLREAQEEARASMAQPPGENLTAPLNGCKKIHQQARDDSDCESEIWDGNQSDDHGTPSTLRGGVAPQVDECMRHVVSAMVLEAEAIELDQAGSIMEAIRKYTMSMRELSAAVASAGLDGAQHTQDHIELVKHCSELSNRLNYLRTRHDEMPFLQVHDQIKPLTLTMQVFPLPIGEVGTSDTPNKDKDAAIAHGGFSWKVVGACAALGSGALTAGLAGGCTALGTAAAAAALPAGAVVTSVTGAAVGALAGSFIAEGSEEMDEGAEAASGELTAQRGGSGAWCGIQDRKPLKSAASIEQGAPHQLGMHGYFHYKPRRRCARMTSKAVGCRRSTLDMHGYHFHRPRRRPPTVNHEVNNAP